MILSPSEILFLHKGNFSPACVSTRVHVTLADLFKVQLCIILTCFTDVFFLHELTNSTLSTEGSTRLSEQSANPIVL